MRTLGFFVRLAPTLTAGFEKMKINAIPGISLAGLLLLCFSQIAITQPAQAGEPVVPGGSSGSGAIVPPFNPPQITNADNNSTYGKNLNTPNPYDVNNGTQSRATQLNPTPSQQHVSPTEAKTSDADKGTVPTAAEQGLIDPRPNALIEWELSQEAQNQTSRQEGVQEFQPNPLNPVSLSTTHRGWLSNWEKSLVDHGMSLEKVRFEEARLSPHDFSRWASNQLRFVIGPQPVLSP